jgi:hypothetical protein
MQIKELVQKMEITDILCDICDKSCYHENGYTPEYVCIDQSWGYSSNKDGTRTQCDICESCFDKVKDFIVNTLKGKVREDVHM